MKHRKSVLKILSANSECFRVSAGIAPNGSGIAEGGDYLHNSPSEARKFNVVQLLISGTSAPTFGNTLLAAGVFKQQNYVLDKSSCNVSKLRPSKTKYCFSGGSHI